MFKCHFVVLILILFSNLIDSEIEHYVKNPIVNTNTGKVKGSVLTTRFDNEFYAFRGIRYAKSPLNELRFKAPEPIDYWDGVFDATEDGPACPQPNNIVQSEDCLRLNIYSKELTNAKKPVVFQIPGGQFDHASGLSTDRGGPRYLMEHDIVFVTINYRLGALGMLGLGISDAPGNAALKDQVIALRWVKSNIEQFGGDPDQITLLGHSSGGFSILLHLVSPMSQNLFSKAIIISAAGFFTKISSDQIQKAHQQAVHVGCTNCSTPQEIFNFMKSTNSVRLYDRLDYEIGLTHLHPYWTAVLEQDFGQERFLIEDPFVAFKNGNFAKVPIVIGFSNAEFASVCYNIIANETIRNLFSEQYSWLLPICFWCEENSGYGEKIAPDFLEAYGISIPLQKEQFRSVEQLYGDGIVRSTVQRIVDYIHNYVDVFYYYLTFSQRFSSFMPDGKPYGIIHADEVKYLFNVHPLFTRNDPENLIVERITRIVVQFALSGNPNKKDDQYIGPTVWQPYTDKNHSYLDFGDELVLKKNLMDDRMNLWYKYLK